MRSVTTPFFPAQIEGAVTLQAVIDARAGDRLPLELALYVSGELGRQVTQLHALGREGSLDPNRVWCTSKGAVVVHEASAGERHDLGPLVYRLLSGSGEVSAWPPSYFNPSVADSIDAAVMQLVNGENPEGTKAMIEALNVATSGLDPEASVSGMARLVYAVSDEPKAAAPVVAVEAPIAQAWLTPRRAAMIAGGVLVLLAGMIGLAVSGSTPKPQVAQPIAVAPIAAAPRAATVDAVKAPKPVRTAAVAKKVRGKTK